LANLWFSLVDGSTARVVLAHTGSAFVEQFFCSCFMETGTPSGEKKKYIFFVSFWCSVMLAGMFCGGCLSCLW
jgi:hypothetical protein